MGVGGGGGLCEGTRIRTTFPSSTELLWLFRCSGGLLRSCSLSSLATGARSSSKLLCNQAGRAVTHLCGPFKPFIMTSLLKKEIQKLISQVDFWSI